MPLGVREVLLLYYIFLNMGECLFVMFKHFSENERHNFEWDFGRLSPWWGSSGTRYADICCCRDPPRLHVDRIYPTSPVIFIAKKKKSCMLFLVFPYEEHAIMKKIKEPNKYF